MFYGNPSGVPMPAWGGRQAETPVRIPVRVSFDAGRIAERVSRFALYAVAALLPIWFLPLPVTVDVGRAATLTALITVSALGWLVSAFFSQEVRIRISPAVYAGVLLLFVWGVSTVFSAVPVLSLSQAEPVAERFATVLAAFLLMVLVGGVFRTQDDARRLVIIFMYSGAVTALLNILQLFGVPVFGFAGAFAQERTFNAVGTVNGLALFYAVLAVVAAAMTVFSGSGSSPVAVIARHLALLVFVLLLLLVNFPKAWVVLLVAAVVLFGFLMQRAPQAESHAKTRRFRQGSRYVILLGIIGVSVAMIAFLRGPVVRSLELPAEVSPNNRATLDIASQVYREDGVKAMAIGVGPGLFGGAWDRFKDRAINDTLFWGAVFHQGSSWVVTALVTGGVLGAVFLVIFFVACFVTGLRAVIGSKSDGIPGLNDRMGASASASAGVIGIAVAAFLYPANLTFVFCLFLFAGVLMLASEGAEGGRGFLKTRNFAVPLGGSWGVFAASLGTVLAVVLGVGVVASEIGRVRAGVFAAGGAEALQAGDIPAALDQFGKAGALEKQNYRHSQWRARAGIEDVRNLVARAAGGENVQAEFLAAVNRTSEDANRAIRLHPRDPSSFRISGALYELIIPFIQGSEELAISRYAGAQGLSPNDPSILLDLGRARLIFADRVGVLQNRASGEAAVTLRAQYDEALKGAIEAFDRAVALKPDYAAGHFLRAQASIRQGDTSQAVQSLERARQGAPQDVGLAFQLGVLYYQRGDATLARGEFARAVSVNPDYANARYFLGLIADGAGERDEAIQEFERVLQLNPGHPEVTRILENLRNGLSALNGIVPPAEPPEKRLETPIK